MIDPTMVDAWLSKKSAKSHPHHLLSSTKQESEAEIDKERKESEAMEKEQKDLRHTLEIIAEVIREVEKNGVDRAAVTEVDRRLSWAHNPEKDPNSALYVLIRPPFPLLSPAKSNSLTVISALVDSKRGN